MFSIIWTLQVNDRILEYIVVAVFIKFNDPILLLFNKPAFTLTKSARSKCKTLKLLLYLVNS